MNKVEDFLQIKKKNKEEILDDDDIFSFSILCK